MSMPNSKILKFLVFLDVGALMSLVIAYFFPKLTIFDTAIIGLINGCIISHLLDKIWYEYDL